MGNIYMARLNRPTPLKHIIILGNSLIHCLENNNVPHETLIEDWGREVLALTAALEQGSQLHHLCTRLVLVGHLLIHSIEGAVDTVLTRSYIIAWHKMVERINEVLAA